jgi:hypothetical protein
MGHFELDGTAAGLCPLAGSVLVVLNLLPRRLWISDVACIYIYIYIYIYICVCVCVCVCVCARSGAFLCICVCVCVCVCLCVWQHINIQANNMENMTPTYSTGMCDMESIFLPVLISYHHALFYMLICKYDNSGNLVMLKILWGLLTRNWKDFLVSEILTAPICKQKQNIKVVSINKGSYIFYYDSNIEVIMWHLNEFVVKADEVVPINLNTLYESFKH